MKKLKVPFFLLIFYHWSSGKKKLSGTSILNTTCAITAQPQNVGNEGESINGLSVISIILPFFSETSCPAPFTRIGNLISCYHVVAEKAAWDVAEAKCQDLNPEAHLVSLESEEVNALYI